MIWLHKGGLQGNGRLIGSYTGGTFSAKIYHVGTYNALISDTDLQVGNVDVGGIIKRSEGLNVVKSTEYLALTSAPSWIAICAGSHRNGR